MTQVASHAPVLTRPAPFLKRWVAVVRAARDSRPLTSLSGDQLAMGLSGLCLVHCLATTIFFASIASVGGVFLDNHLFHEIGLIIAIGFALITLVSGVLSHGYMMPFATISPISWNRWFSRNTPPTEAIEAKKIVVARQWTRHRPDRPIASWSPLSDVSGRESRAARTNAPRRVSAGAWLATWVTRFSVQRL